jgi:hypothetical protein
MTSKAALPQPLARFEPASQVGRKHRILAGKPSEIDDLLHAFVGSFSARRFGSAQIPLLEISLPE